LGCFAAKLDPIRAEAGDVFIQGDPAPATGFEVYPALAHQHAIMVGKSEEIVAVILIPAHNHLRIIIAITPEGMRMQIAFPPVRFGGGRGSCDCSQQTDKCQRAQWDESASCKERVWVVVHAY